MAAPTDEIHAFRRAVSASSEARRERTEYAPFRSSVSGPFRPYRGRPMAVQRVVTVVDPAADDRNLLAQETVPMTVLAQDPSIVDADGPIRTALPVPAGRLQRGPRGHRFQ